LAFGLCNFVNLAKRGEGLAYMPSLFTLGIGKVTWSPRVATCWGRASLATLRRQTFLRAAHRSSINARYSIGALPIICVFAYRSSINVRYSIDALRIVFASKDSSKLPAAMHKRRDLSASVEINLSRTFTRRAGRRKARQKKNMGPIIFFFTKWLCQTIRDSFYLCHIFLRLGKLLYLLNQLCKTVGCSKAYLLGMLLGHILRVERKTSSGAELQPIGLQVVLASIVTAEIYAKNSSFDSSSCGLIGGPDDPKFPRLLMLCTLRLTSPKVDDRPGFL